MSQLAKKFQKRLAKVNANPWIAATSQDAKYPSVKGLITSPSIADKFIGWYMNQVIRLTTTANNSQTTLDLSEVFPL